MISVLYPKNSTCTQRNKPIIIPPLSSPQLPSLTRGTQNLKTLTRVLPLPCLFQGNVVLSAVRILFSNNNEVFLYSTFLYFWIESRFFPTKLTFSASRSSSPDLLASDDESGPPIIPTTLRGLPPYFPQLPPKHTYLQTPVCPHLFKICFLFRFMCFLCWY